MTEHGWRRRGTVLFGTLFAVCVFGLAGCHLLFLSALPVPAPGNVQPRPVGVITDTPTISIAGAAATSTATPTTSAHEAQVQWAFGTVAGSYGSCTVQAKTSYDGVNYLNLGSAVAVTVANNTLNAWTLIEQLGTGSVTSSAASSTSALGFGQLTEFVFSCSTYGTSAPVNINVIYR
jgi:hypothetical protein